MTEQPNSPRLSASPRDEKLQAIAAVFGDAVAARLASPHSAELGRKTEATPTDAGRVAWQTNRLIQHMRTRVAAEGALPSASLPNATSAQKGATGQRRKVAKLPTLAAGEDLSAEHPAVIAHLLRDAPQQMRVAILRALPGQLARAVMRRLKAA